jgi:predicted ABC-type ATPase
MPLLTVVAGPKGSGKSTLTSGLYGLAEGEVIDPDVIARRLHPIRPASAALLAAQRAILRCRELLAAPKRLHSKPPSPATEASLLSAAHERRNTGA